MEKVFSNKKIIAINYDRTVSTNNLEINYRNHASLKIYDESSLEKVGMNTIFSRNTEKRINNCVIKHT